MPFIPHAFRLAGCADPPCKVLRLQTPRFLYPVSQKVASIVAGNHLGQFAPSAEQGGDFGAFLLCLPLADVDYEIVKTEAGEFINVSQQGKGSPGKGDAGSLSGCL